MAIIIHSTCSPADLPAIYVPIQSSVHNNANNTGAGNNSGLANFSSSLTGFSSPSAGGGPNNAPSPGTSSTSGGGGIIVVGNSGGGGVNNRPSVFRDVKPIIDAGSTFPLAESPTQGYMSEDADAETGDSAQGDMSKRRISSPSQSHVWTMYRILRWSSLLHPIFLLLKPDLALNYGYKNTVKPRYNVSPGTSILQRYIEINVISREFHIGVYREGPKISTLKQGKTLFRGTLFRGSTVVRSPCPTIFNSAQCDKSTTLWIHSSLWTLYRLFRRSSQFPEHRIFASCNLSGHGLWIRNNGLSLSAHL